MASGPCFISRQGMCITLRPLCWSLALRGIQRSAQWLQITDNLRSLCPKSNGWVAGVRSGPTRFHRWGQNKANTCASFLSADSLMSWRLTFAGFRHLVHLNKKHKLGPILTVAMPPLYYKNKRSVLFGGDTGHYCQDHSILTITLCGQHAFLKTVRRGIRSYDTDRMS